MQAALRRMWLAGSKRRVVVERLMVGLEIGTAAGRLRRIDHLAAPGSRAACRRRSHRSTRPHTRPSAMFFALSRSPMVGAVCGGSVVAVAGIAHRRLGVVGRRRIAARLIRRLHGVHRVELAVAEIVRRRDIAALHEFGRPVERRGRRIRGRLEPRQIAARRRRVSSTAIDGLAAAVSATGVLRRAGADQILVVEERAAERALEEVVRQHVFTRRARTARTGWSRSGPWSGRRHPTTPRNRSLRAAVDLHLIFEEAVIQIARHDRGRQRRCRIAA